MTPMIHEVNFDAIVGPTHNYAGLAYGNVASGRNRQSVSNPRQAALEGLAKMKFLADLGVKQAVLPPPLRPDLDVLRSLGYGGSDAQALEAAAREDPALLAAVGSASAMWAANAATVSPSADSADGRVHFSPANLLAQFHRSIEPPATAAALRAIFPEGDHFAHHPPLPAHARFADEGAANHTRLSDRQGESGLQLFVYGRRFFDPSAPTPSIFPARQSDLASRALARRHRLAPYQALFIQQNPSAIDRGVFHNDVASVGHQNVFFCHAQAFVDQAAVLAEMAAAFERLAAAPLHIVQVAAEELSLDEAVQTYLFNSQIVTLPDGSMALIAPGECEDHPRARAAIDRLIAAGTPIRTLHFVSVRQSMRNGGGPACLRLRVWLNDGELAAMHQGVLLTEALHGRLTAWVKRHYRERLSPAELADPKLLEEGKTALGELSDILGPKWDRDA